MPSPIIQAIKQVCEEKGLSYESVLATLEAALAAAYRKDFGQKNQNIKVEFDPESGSMRAFDIKTVVRDFTEEELEALKTKEEEPVQPRQPIEEPKGEEAPAELEQERFNPKTMMMISEAQKLKPDAVLGEELRIELQVPGAFGRMAAQTAKQVITQRLREAERQTIFDEFKSKEGQILLGVIGRTEGRLIFVELGRATAILPPGEQIEHESYRPGARMKFYLVSVNLAARGPELVVSRTHPEMLRQVLIAEIPEIQSGAVEIKSIAREAGARSKVAVYSNVPNIDPIGACIGQKGSRIQTIISEIGGEKIDVIKWEEDQARFITSAMSPAKALDIQLHEAEKQASVKVAPDQLSLAIGRGGQNVRLASILTGWKISIAGQEEVKEAAEEVVEEKAVEEVPVTPAAMPPEEALGGEAAEEEKA